MKKITLLFVSSCFISLLFSCSKSGTKALEQGDYYNAVIQSVEKLKKDPDNDKALGVLPEAYTMAKADLLQSISRGKSANMQFKWEAVLEDYNKLNKMSDLISRCSSCRRGVNPVAFFKEADQAREKAAIERYAFANTNLNSNTMEGGRIAFESFQTLFDYAPNYKDVRTKMDDALMLASYHVVVEPAKVNSRLYKLSSDYFNDQINAFLTENKRVNKYIRFYQPQEAESINLKPDHIVKLDFLDFVVGETFLETEKETLISKDSVKTGSVKVRGKEIDSYGKVKADFVYTNKVITSKGILGLQIIDFRSNKVLLSKEFPGEFVWQNEWATYNGDERALTKEQLRLADSKEILPPGPEQMFIEFCKPIHSQATNQIKRFYDDY